MKFRHNKKRNPAFIFEALTREFAKAKLHKDQDRLNRVNRVKKRVAQVKAQKLSSSSKY